MDTNYTSAAGETGFLPGVLRRSATDLDFRQQLLADPTAALTEVLGRAPSHPVNLVFVENHADVTLVLPDPIDHAAELSEEELEMVAGGVSSDPATLAVVGSIVGVIASGVAIYDAWFDN